MNKARKSVVNGGEKALIHMIELFLNPNNEEMMDDIDFENGENRSAEKTLARN